MQDSIPVFEPFTGIRTIKAVTDAFNVGWLGMGAFTQQFEERVADYLELKDRHILATNTGTSALHLALLIAGIGQGDEVIVPSLNFVADLQAITAVGATPVFCDVREDTLGVDVTSIERLISDRTRAIMPLHYAGVPCDLDGIYQLAEVHALRVIEDATHAFGSRWRNTRIGSIGDLTCFSFDPVKIITCIDGGAVVCRTEHELLRLRQLRFLGIDKETTERYKNQRAWEYDVVSEGFRYHLTNINASIGLSQLEGVDGFIESRQATCRRYTTELSNLSGISVPATNFSDVSPFIYTIRVRSDWRLAFIDFLRARGIATGIHFLPAHRFTFYAHCRRGPLPVTESAVEELVTLPLHSHMQPDKEARVVDAIWTFVHQRARAAA